MQKGLAVRSLIVMTELLDDIVSITIFYFHLINVDDISEGIDCCTAVAIMIIKCSAILTLRALVGPVVLIHPVSKK